MSALPLHRDCFSSYSGRFALPSGASRSARKLDTSLSQCGGRVVREAKEARSVSIGLQTYSSVPKGTSVGPHISLVGFGCDDPDLLGRRIRPGPLSDSTRIPPAVAELDVGLPAI